MRLYHMQHMYHEYDVFFCQGKDDTFSGKVNTGPPGKMQVFSQAKGEENFAALLEYDVRVFFFKQITCIDTIISSSRNINSPKAFSCCSKKPECNFFRLSPRSRPKKRRKSGSRRSRRRNSRSRRGGKRRKRNRSSESSNLKRHKKVL